jgi:hypothetical protein
MVPSWGQILALLRAYCWAGRRSNNTQQGNQCWPLLGAQHLVSRKSNGTQQGTNTGPTWGPNT